MPALQRYDRNQPIPRSRLELSSAVLLGIIGLALTVVVACGGSDLRLPADAAGTALFEQAQEELAAENWRKAGDAFDTLLRNYPTSPYLAEARLGLGRAYYEQNRLDTLMLAIDAFQNFRTYHPSHADVDYAQLMVGLSYVSLMKSPDRDQSNTRLAMESLRNFLEDFPNSSYAESARENLQRAVDSLAERELRVAEWQFERDRYGAAVNRCEYALRHYSDSGWKCEIQFLAAESLRKWGQRERANSYYQQLIDDQPSCARVASAKERLQEGGAADSGN